MAARRLLLVLGLLVTCHAVLTPQQMDRLRGMAKAYLKVPDGYEVAPFSNGPGGARSLAIAPSGTIFVTAEAVYALRDMNGDGYAESVKAVTAVAPGGSAHGCAFYNGTLYASVIDSVYRFPDIESHLDDPTPMAWNNIVIAPGGPIPVTGGHTRRYMRISPEPESKIYLTIGTPCNTVCSPVGKYLRFNLDGSNVETMANGIRSSVGMDWHPLWKELLFFTDNGRDLLGDNYPPDELNRMNTSESAANYGHPNCISYNIPDPESNPLCINGVCPANACDGNVGANQALYAHGAGLGIRFDHNEGVYKHQAYIAHHGSWNRFPWIGYCVTVMRFNNDVVPPYATGMENYLWGFLPNNQTIACSNSNPCPTNLTCSGGYCSVWGRPADVEILLDGSVVVSDDYNGMLWRVAVNTSWVRPPPAAPPPPMNMTGEVAAAVINFEAALGYEGVAIGAAVVLGILLLAVLLIVAKRAWCTNLTVEQKMHAKEDAYFRARGSRPSEHMDEPLVIGEKAPASTAMGSAASSSKEMSGVAPGTSSAGSKTAPRKSSSSAPMPAVLAAATADANRASTSGAGVGPSTSSGAAGSPLARTSSSTKVGPAPAAAAPAKLETFRF